ncbi:Bifunctional NAD(P)H-hydrate repair enzyme Nnr [Aliiroseovarius sp. xm-v-225]|uniref:NAD(P)H-hydrate dehydratase n=1 Tax=unclassified Aliiroseovarius TaxID=2623558 RepID=UPI001567CB97|nr:MULTISPECIES: NAD(P)H-hydrate dehydratase [unclassified Aliiroseovarius]NRP45079.1 Bifunctional NAD(P)H-hydrate repair enzyme Nnr [Aliiroseovarius sp. xm-m-378]NRP65950.1 Bifunctional NAD(P)H-hydrate repair enzyme Nnr [Aliiroseovarius sp. xm-v-225]NRP92766.1 Bifunctional NAD(P)H-hydrate repair enzyme Nnr [Aliiroseovarius sp. xm-a-134]
MTELLTAAQMRAIEQAAIDSGEVTGLELMERAGRGVVEAIFEEWPELAVGEKAGQGGTAPHPASGIRPFIGRNDPPDHFQEALEPQDISDKKKRAVVLCGPGNNGGDGFVVARLLHLRGWEVEVFLYGDATRLPPDARVNYERWCALGEVKALADDVFDGWPEEDDGVDLIIDALFGTGLKRPFLGFRHLAMALNYCSSSWELHDGLPRVVAVDVPSGLCADSGKWLGDDQPLDHANLANLTLTFHSEKNGHLLENGPPSCGTVDIVDIGLSSTQGPGTLSRNTLIHLSGEARLGRVICRKVTLPLNPYVSKFSDEHKYSHGHALILSGPSGKGGAARLSARGALRIGAGLVTVAPTPGAVQENAARLDAIMLSPVGDKQALEAVLADERFNAICLGPGLGIERVRELVPVALRAQRATLLDADALTAFAEEPQAFFDQLHENCVLTPHGGEFARLFPDVAEKLNAPATKGPAYSKVDATREAAARAGCVVLFKGPDTVIAAPDGRCSISSAHYDRSAPWLATAGSGDVLAGFVTGLLARGFSPMQAAETAAWLHVECALEFGPGLIAEDLPEMLPKVFRKIGA